MSAPRKLAIAVLLIFGVCVAYFVQSRGRITEHTAHAMEHATAHAAVPVAKTAGLSPNVATRELVRSDPERAAHLWQTRANAVITAKYERMFGALVAGDLALPPAEAWTALTDVAKGDGKDAAAAATAALLLANSCNALSQFSAQATAQHDAYMAGLTSALPSDWTRFVRTLDADDATDMKARVASCAGVGGVLDFALMMLDRSLLPDQPDVRLSVAEDERDDATAIADLRQLVDENGGENAQRALGERLMKSRDIAQQIEGRALLESLADDDPDVVSFLAGCFSQGCSFFRSDPAVAAEWIERAAGQGDFWAFDVQITKLKATENVVDAWAWALYRLDLASAGCFEFGQPNVGWLAKAAQDVSRIGQTLDAPQQATGEADARAIESQWEATAKIDLAAPASRLPL